MEFILELVLELILDGTLEIISNQKVPKWIRYPLILILSSLVFIVIIGIFILGLYTYKENIIISLILIISSIVLLIGSIIKLKKRLIISNNNITIS